MSNLTVISVIALDKTLDLMVRSVKKFTHPTPRFIFCDNMNGFNNDRIKELMSADDDYEIVNNRIKPYTSGSIAHALGLNRVFPMVTTEYTAIVESDVAVLSEDWYKIQPDFVMKAARKIDDLHHVCFIIFKTEKLKDIDFGSGEMIQDQSQQPHFDVGNQIRFKVREKQIEQMKFVDCKVNGVLFKDLQCDEFHDQSGKVLATHFGRGSNIGNKVVREGFATTEKQRDAWRALIEDKLK